MDGCGGVDAVCLFHAEKIMQHQFGQTEKHPSRLRSSLRTVAVLSLSTALMNSCRAAGSCNIN